MKQSKWFEGDLKWDIHWPQTFNDIQALVFIFRNYDHSDLLVIFLRSDFKFVIDPLFYIAVLLVNLYVCFALISDY